jgi:hypothetical protein
MGISNEARVSPNVLFNEREYRVHQRCFPFVQKIVDPTPFFSGAYHFGLSQDLEMTGQRRLANFQGIHELTDTELGPQQSSEDPNPGGIRYRLSKLTKLSHKYIYRQLPIYQPILPEPNDHFPARFAKSVAFIPLETNSVHDLPRRV